MPFGRAYTIGDVGELEQTYIGDRSHVRAMKSSMRYATIAAGMALENAGLKSQPAILERTGLFVAARFGERDEDADLRIVREIADAEDHEVRLNAMLARELRPGLFLAQLPNLFAGNISLIYQVKGPSMTFLGEHGAGGRAVLEAAESIADGSIDVALVGGCYNSLDYQTYFVAAGDSHLAPDRDDADVSAAEPWMEGSGGTVPGSAAAFLVLESAEHARARSAEARAELSHVSFDDCPRSQCSVSDSLHAQYRECLTRGARPGAFLVTGSGIEKLDTEELRFLLLATRDAPSDVQLTSACHGVGDVGHATFSMQIALAAGALERNHLFEIAEHPRRRPLPERVKLSSSSRAGKLDSIRVVTSGVHQSQSMAVVRKVSSSDRGAQHDA
jgi:3-oxoacyl-[acyl-carrier-protein] synthase II